MRRLAAIVVMTGCGDFAASVRPPLPPPPPVPLVLESPPVYIENNYTYNFNAPPEPDTQPDVPPPPAPEPVAPTPAPAAPSPHPIPVAYCTCVAAKELPAERRALPTTTVPKCDAYLAMSELSVRCSGMEAKPLARMIKSFDRMRATWRKVAAQGNRSIWTDSCDMGLAAFADSIEDLCGSGS